MTQSARPSEDSKCWVFGGYPNGFTIKCAGIEEEKQIVANLVDVLPKMTSIRLFGAGRFDVMDDRMVDDIKLEQHIAGAMLEAGIEWKELEGHQLRGVQFYYKNKRFVDALKEDE